MKSIYDEAIEKVDWIFSNSKIPNYELRSICVALERAKKIEGLLGLYRKRDKFSGYKETYKSITSEINALEEKLEDLIK